MKTVVEKSLHIGLIRHHACTVYLHQIHSNILQSSAAQSVYSLSFVLPLYNGRPGYSALKKTKINSCYTFGDELKRKISVDPPTSLSIFTTSKTSHCIAFSYATKCMNSKPTISIDVLSFRKTFLYKTEISQNLHPTLEQMSVNYKSKA